MKLLMYSFLLFITATPAFAQTPGQPGILVQMMPLLLIFAVFWLLLIRPQQKKLKEHQKMVAALRRGDKIVTAGGLVGTLKKVVDEKEVDVEIASGVTVRIIRSTISTVLSKPEPVAEVAPKTSNNNKKKKKSA